VSGIWDCWLAEALSLTILPEGDHPPSNRGTDYSRIHPWWDPLNNGHMLDKRDESYHDNRIEKWRRWTRHGTDKGPSCTGIAVIMLPSVLMGEALRPPDANSEDLITVLRHNIIDPLC
jgi:hypothetical protein